MSFKGGIIEESGFSTESRADQTREGVLKLVEIRVVIAL